MSRTQIPDQPTGAHWGAYASTSVLPNAASGPVTNFLSPGDLASVLGELYVCTSPGGGGDGTVSTWAEVSLSGGDVAEISAGLVHASAVETVSIDVEEDATVGGDIAAVGGFRQTVGPFTAPGAAGVVAASQTNLDLRHEHTVTAAALSYVATRPGSLMGISGQLSAAITGASQTLVISATKNGTEVALTATFTQAGAEVARYAVVAKDALTFVAGDVLGISYTSGTISNTPALVASLEIES